MLEVIICGNDSLPLYTQTHKCAEILQKFKLSNLNQSGMVCLKFFPRLKTHNIK